MRSKPSPLQVSQRPAGDVEGEGRGASSRGAAPCRCCAKHVADAVRSAQIGGGVGARGRADLALVDEDDVGDALGALDRACTRRDADGLAEPLLEAR